jgi:hypothetical protein
MKILKNFRIKFLFEDLSLFGDDKNFPRVVLMKDNYSRRDSEFVHLLKDESV